MEPMPGEAQPERSPDQVVLDFLDTLPTTIREQVLFKCCFGVEAADFADLALEDRLTILEKFLRDPSFSTSYRCAQLIGVVEMVLEPPASKAEKPLAWAEIKVVDVPGRPGEYKAVAHMRPHFQLEALDISLRMVAKQLGK